MLKQIFFIILIAISMIACGRRSRDIEYNVSLLPCLTDQTEESGYVDCKGHFVSTRYSDEMTPVINGFCLLDGTLYRVGKSIADTTPVLRNLVESGIMNEGLMPICFANGYISIIDKDGHHVFTLTKFGGKEVRASYSYSNSKLRVVLEDNTFVYVDKNGQQLFDHIYSYATDFKNGYAIVQTVNQNNDLYSLIDNTGTPVFTFESTNSDYITISHDLKLLSTIIEDRVIVYDFKGKTILNCPSKVQEIYGFCYDGFIYMNDDGEFGLMSYDGDVLIRAKYEQLVPHGRNYLALTDDDEILLINKKGTILKDWEGEEIFDFRHEGFDFPAIINTEDDGYIILDEEGNIILDKIDEFWNPDYLYYLSTVESQYFPEERMLNTIIELCGNGIGISDKYGAYFVRGAEHCHPTDIPFLSSDYSRKDLEGYYGAWHTVEEGLNYRLSYVVGFDKPMVNIGENTFNPTAWLNRVTVHLLMPSVDLEKAFLKQLVQEMRMKGCTEYYSNKSRYILFSKDKQQLFVMYQEWMDKEYEFCIRIVQNTSKNREIEKLYIDNIHN